MLAATPPAVRRARTRLTARQALISVADLPPRSSPRSWRGSVLSTAGRRPSRTPRGHPTLAALAAGVVATVRGHLPALAQRGLQRRLRPLARLPLRCPQGQPAATSHDWRPRAVLTTCGRLHGERPWARYGRGRQQVGARASVPEGRRWSDAGGRAWIARRAQHATNSSPAASARHPHMCGTPKRATPCAARSVASPAQTPQGGARPPTPTTAPPSASALVPRSLAGPPPPDPSTLTPGPAEERRGNRGGPWVGGTRTWR